MTRGAVAFAGGIGSIRSADRSGRSSILALTAAILAAAVFFTPYPLWRASTEYFITISDVLFALAAILMLASRAIEPRPFASWTPLWLVAFATMLLGLLIGSLVNGDPIRWLSGAAQYAFGFVALPCLLMARQPGWSILFARAFLAGVFGMEAFGLIVFYFAPELFEQHQQIAFEFVTGAGRLGAFLGDANWNGAIISMALPFALFLWWSRRLSSSAGALILLVLVGALVASGSFTGFVSGAAAVLIFLLVAGGRASLKFMVGVGVAVGLLFASGYRLPEIFQKRVAVAIAEGDISQAGTFVGRLDLIEEAWDIVEDTSLVGLGVDQYRVISRQQAPVHNIYLLLWAEGGLLSLIGWLTMMSILWIGSMMACRVDRRAGALGLSVLVTFVLFSIAAPHMYARIWIVPLIVAMAIAFFPREADTSSATNEYPARTEE